MQSRPGGGPPGSGLAATVLGCAVGRRRIRRPIWNVELHLLGPIACQHLARAASGVCACGQIHSTTHQRSARHRMLPCLTPLSPRNTLSPLLERPLLQCKASRRSRAGKHPATPLSGCYSCVPVRLQHLALACASAIRRISRLTAAAGASRCACRQSCALRRPFRGCSDASSRSGAQSHGACVPCVGPLETPLALQTHHPSGAPLPRAAGPSHLTCRESEL